MKRLKKALIMAGCAAVLALGSSQAMAQRGGGRNFDPAQMRADRLTSLKEQFEVTDEAEWKVLETALGKVLDAQTELRADQMRGGPPGGRRRGGNNGDTANADANAQPRQRRGPTQATEVEDLQKAVEAKAPAAELNAKLAKLREIVKAKEAKLQSAQDDLKKLLTPRQEAVSVLNGILK